MNSLSAVAKLCRDFQEIEDTAYHRIVRFYDRHRQDIELLDFDNFFDIQVKYTNALFEIGAYSKHLVEVDRVILLSIENNIRVHNGMDIYFESLFRKAASHFNNLEFEPARHILRELLKMDPNYAPTVRFYKKCLLREPAAYKRNIRAASILLFLTATIITAFEVIVIRSFARDWLPFFEISKVATFVLGLSLLTGAFIYRYFEVQKIVNQDLEEIRKSKKKRVKA